MKSPKCEYFVTSSKTHNSPISMVGTYRSIETEEPQLQRFEEKANDCSRGMNPTIWKRQICWLR